MRNFWLKMNHLTRHQVFLRVLPVVFVSIVVLGGASWLLFEDRTLSTAAEYQQQKLVELTTRLRYRVARLAMTAELRKSEITSDLAAVSLSETQIAEEVVKSVIELEPVMVTAQVSPTQGLLTHLVITSPFDTEQNRGILDDWYQSKAVLWVNHVPGTGWTPPPMDGPPTILESDPWHQILLFPPVFLDLQSTPRTQLPLLVRRKTTTGDHTQTLMLVDLGSLLAEADIPDWFCLVNSSGKMLWRQDRTDSGFFAEKSGLDLLDMGRGLAKGDHKSGLIGRWREPWLVTATASPTLPVMLLSAHPAASLRNLIMKYLVFVAGLAVLALLGSVLGVMRVMGPVTRRIEALSESMAALAKGEYSRRLPEDRRDEIGQLIVYFNLMASSLDEAHREVKEKAVHLRAALENMQMLDRAKDDFLMLISHEVRTPLTAIMGGVDYLLKAVEKTSDDEKKFLNSLNLMEVTSIIQSSGERLSGFMTDAIQMTAIQSSGRRLDLKLTPVADLVELGLIGIREQAAARGIRVENQIGEQVWSVLGDANILKMALEKVFNNAVKHNRDGGKILIREAWEVPGLGGPAELVNAEGLRILMEQSSYRQWEGEEIRWRLVEVFNSGEPIPEDRRTALFGKFELVGRIENHKQGSGLSLPITRGAVECHGGQVYLHSDKRDGNSFFILLPTILDQDAVSVAMALDLWDEVNQGVGGAAGDKKMGEVTDLASFKVEIDDLGSAIDGNVHQTGGRVDGSGCSDDKEKVTIGSSRK
jgi:signal transduction histidine kinase